MFARHFVAYFLQEIAEICFLFVFTIDQRLWTRYLGGNFIGGNEPAINTIKTGFEVGYAIAYITYITRPIFSAASVAIAIITALNALYF